MPWSSEHTKWLIDTGERLTSVDGKEIQVLKFQHQVDDSMLSAWAKHYRNHYCLDTQIDALRRGTGLSRKQYLNQIKFPDKSTTFGPRIRAGDFAEILAADFLQYTLNYWVPRMRYSDKTVRDESKKGVDTIGFLFINEGQESPQDKMVIIESKAKYTGNTENKLQDAINHSAKDILRKAESLNAMKQRMLDTGNQSDATKVERFQNETEKPYEQYYGAMAHLDDTTYDSSVISTANTSNHPFAGDLFLITIKGREMMNLVHELYRRAADEA